MGPAAVAYIALLASRLPWFLGGAAPAAAGAGYTYVHLHEAAHHIGLNIALQRVKVLL